MLQLNNDSSSSDLRNTQQTQTELSNLNTSSQNSYREIELDDDWNEDIWPDENILQLAEIKIHHLVTQDNPTIFTNCGSYNKDSLCLDENTITHEEATKGPNAYLWQQSIQNELDAMQAHKVWPVQI